MGDIQMITFNSERGLVVVENWGDIEGRPGFVKNLDPSKHELKAIIGRYVFRDRIRCGLSNCHTPHAKGYIVVTVDGCETNIGKDCGRAYFGVDFDVLSRQFDRDLTAAENRETLASFAFRIEELEMHIDELRTASRGADWVYKLTRLLLAYGRGCPEFAVRRISEMVRSRSPVVTVERAASEEEVLVMEVAAGRKLSRPQMISEPIGQLRGLEALYPENDLRQLLVLDLAEQLVNFKKQDILTMSYEELRRWAKWAATTERTIDMAANVVTTGQSLLEAENLAILGRLAPTSVDEASFGQFLTQLE